MDSLTLSEHELQGLYTWVDEIPLSRPKRNIARDFSDGVLLAEIVAHYFPKLVELHNYSAANSTNQKMYNWNTMNQKVFKRLGFTVSKQDFEAISNCQPGAIERLLKLAKTKIAKAREDGGQGIVPTAPVVPRVAQLGSPHAHHAHEPPAPAHTSYTHTNGQAAAHGHAQVTVARNEALAEKDANISELRETNEILETKVRKLEQLVRLKDAKIATLMAKLQSAGLN